MLPWLRISTRQEGSDEVTWKLQLSVSAKMHVFLGTQKYIEWYYTHGVCSANYVISDAVMIHSHANKHSVCQVNVTRCVCWLEKNIFLKMITWVHTLADFKILFGVLNSICFPWHIYILYHFKAYICTSVAAWLWNFNAVHQTLTTVI